MAPLHPVTLAVSISVLGVASAEEGGLRNSTSAATFAKDGFVVDSEHANVVLAATTSQTSHSVAHAADILVAGHLSEYHVCLKMCARSGFCGNNADGTFCNNVASCQQGCLYAAQGRRAGALPDVCESVCTDAANAACKYKGKYDGRDYNMCAACPGSEVTGGAGMGSCLQWPSRNFDCPSGCRFFQQASGTYVEMYRSVGDCKEGKAPVKFRRLTGELETNCVGCWDRCEENDTGYPVFRLRGPGVAAVAWNCIGKFDYASADFARGGAFSEATGCFQAGGGGAVVMCDGGAKNHNAELKQACQTTVKMFHSLDDCRKGNAAKERVLTDENDLFCKDCWDRCSESDSGYPVFKLDGPGVAAVAWNCVGKFGTYSSAGFARGGVFTAADDCYEAGGGGAVVLCSGDAQGHEQELAEVCELHGSH